MCDGKFVDDFVFFVIDCVLYVCNVLLFGVILLLVIGCYVV